MTMTLAELLAPVAPERFFAEHHDRQPLHVRGDPAKFAAVLSWRGINRLLDMTHIWSSHSLQLVMDGVPVPAEQYCTRAVGRDANEQLWQPVAAKVQDWTRRGASLVLNDVDSLSPGLRAVSDALEDAGLGKAQGNVYISWQSHKAFPAHFDTHDVWAVQVEGEKTWNVWEGRAEWPIAHPAFRGLAQAQHEQAKRGLRTKVHMKPGDLLYLRAAGITTPWPRPLPACTSPMACTRRSAWTCCTCCSSAPWAMSSSASPCRGRTARRRRNSR